MAIIVVCPGCKKRFTVDDKFAGKKGPCKNCKTVIEIPKKEEEVVIHAPDEAGPKDSKGKSVIKPIARQETRFNGVAAGLIAAGVLVIFLVAWVVGSSYLPKEKGKPAQVPWPFQAVAALLLAPPLVVGGYSFLRNDELEPYRGKELWLRAAICGAIYAALWAVYALIPWALDMEKGFEIVQLVYVAPPFVLAGAFVAFASLELEYTSGLIHYGLYLLVTVLLRVAAQMNAF